MIPTRDNETHIEAARLGMLIPAVRRSFLTSALSITIFSVLLFRFSPVGLSLWLGLRAVVTVVGLGVLQQLSAPTVTSTRRKRSLVTLMAVSGVVWGLIPAFVQPADPEWRAVTILWLFGNQSVITAVCSASRAVFRAAAGSVTLVGAVAIASGGDSFGLVLAALLLLGGVYSSSISTSIHRVVTAAIEGQLETAELASSLTQRQVELESANRLLEDLASRDGLTRLPNRRSFATSVADEDGHLRVGCWVGFIDLDRFKTINDTLGHAVGDLVLITVADRWSRLLPVGALLARTGGDEFALFLPNAGADEALELAQRLIGSLADPIDVDEANPIDVSCSIGMCRGAAGEPFASAMVRADAALYEMKTKGRNGVVLRSAATTDPATTGFDEGA